MPRCEVQFDEEVVLCDASLLNRTWIDHHLSMRSPQKARLHCLHASFVVPRTSMRISPLRGRLGALSWHTATSATSEHCVPVPHAHPPQHAPGSKMARVLLHVSMRPLRLRK